MGRLKAEIVLNDCEREQLETWTRRRKTAQALALRSRIVLELRTIGQARANFAMTMMTACYNLKRLVYFQEAGIEAF